MKAEIISEESPLRLIPFSVFVRSEVRNDEPNPPKKIARKRDERAIRNRFV